MYAYVDGGTNLTDYFCPDAPPPPACNDNDGDDFSDEGGDCGPVDCNDNNASINPGAVEKCTDNIDNNCNKLVDEQDPNAVNCPSGCIDADEDGYAENCSPVDCDDTDPNVHPGAFEFCADGIDNNCDGNVDSADSYCPADSCRDYGDRNRCKTDPRCNWSGKEKSCDEIPTAQLDCQKDGGRWNKKKGTCR